MLKFDVFGFEIRIAESIIGMWYIMAAMIVFALVIYYFVKSGRFKEKPESKFQLFIEAVVEMVYNLTRENMGARNVKLAPYIGTLAMLLLLCNMSGLAGFKKVPTADYSVSLGLALATFIVVQVNQFKAHKAKGYFLELFDPIPALFPLKILEKFTPVLSMSLRLFCNMIAGYIVMELIYSSLRAIKIPVLNNIPIFMAFIPIPIHFYFDIFDAFIQTIVFVMLTMVLTNIATQGVHDEHETSDTHKLKKSHSA